jgi:hypothetical protein
VLDLIGQTKQRGLQLEVLGRCYRDGGHIEEERRKNGQSRKLITEAATSY